jgi:hypothetical protein
MNRLLKDSGITGIAIGDHEKHSIFKLLQTEFFAFLLKIAGYAHIEIYM